MLKNRFFWMILMDENKPPEGAGGGGGASIELDALKLEHQKLVDKLKSLEIKPTELDHKSLAEKARIEREKSEKLNFETKNLESALRFSMGSPDWLKTNAALLPKNIDGIFKAADQENYANPIEKSNAIRSGIIQEFFSIQTNLDLLTENQKIGLEEFKKLTKDVKESKAKDFYDQVFEPTFENLKRLEKAKQVSKGLGNPSDAESIYRKRMTDLSQKQFLKGK